MIAALCVIAWLLGRDQAAIEVQVDAPEVVFGSEFELRVVRTWEETRQIEPWDDGSLAPLFVELDEVSERTADGWIRETRRYRARAFSLSDVVVGPVTLRVVPAVDRENPGAAELPGGPLPLPTKHSSRWWIAAGVIALLFAGWRLTQRRESSAPVSAVPVETPAERALRRLDRLRRDHGEDAADPLYADVARVIREYTADRYAALSASTTTEAFGTPPSAPSSLNGEARTELPLPIRLSLAGFLSRCDAVKFGGRDPSSERRTQFFDELREFWDGDA